MSRSQQTNTEKPADFYAEWKGREGKLMYRKDKEWIEIPMPFTFMVLDQLDTVVGFDGKANKGYYSTEVRASKKDTIFVYKDGALFAKGVWTDDDLKRHQDLKFAKSIYIAYYDEKRELRVGNIKASGTFRNEWFEFTRHKNIYDGTVTLVKAVEAKHGANKFYAPVFEQGFSLTPETEKAALALDEKLQEYLRDYLHDNRVTDRMEAPVIAANEPAPAPIAGTADDEWEDIPF